MCITSTGKGLGYARRLKIAGVPGNQRRGFGNDLSGPDLLPQLVALKLGVIFHAACRDADRVPNGAMMFFVAGHDGM